MSAMKVPDASSRTTLFPDEEREVRPFFVIVVVVIAVLYVLALFTSADLRTPQRFIPFTFLIIVHAALHLASPRIARGPRDRVIYFLLQGAFAFVLPLVAQGAHIVMGLYMALVGEAVGFLRKSAVTAIIILIYFALAVSDLLLLSESNSLTTWALLALPTSVFVIVYVVLYDRQAQARTRAQALFTELETANRQLSEYAARVEDLTLANERQRMARELHDTLAQGLAGVILQLEAANNHLTNGRTDRAQTILQQAMTRARATLADARRAIDDLRAGQTVPGDLDEALSEQVAHFTDATGIPCALEIALPSELPDAVKEHTLRAVTEGLTNIARHAQAQHAWVNVRTANGDLIVELRDDGRGFDPAAIPPGHYGLLGMRERARLASGGLEITSAPGAGTTLRLQMPLGAPSP